MKFTEQIFSEAIELSKAREYIKDWDKDRLKDWFGGKYRVYLDLEKKAAAAKDLESELEKEVKKSLQNTDFEVKDFKQGMAYDKKNKREVKLGKVLSKIDKELLQKFANDPNREASKVSEPIVVISRHPYDIAGQSYKRGWTSCKDLSHGSNSRFVKDEAHSTLIAYLIYKDDKNINQPIARVLINQFFNKKGKIHYIQQVKQYGSSGVWEGALFHTIQKWLDSKQGKQVGVFKLNPFQYADSLGNEVTLRDFDNVELPDWVNESGNTPKKYFYDKKDPRGFIWEKGTWNDGRWEMGTWEDGEWRDGIWVNGVWKTGTWENGTWEDGTWRFGNWRAGIWRDGEWQDGTWDKGLWIKGTWKGGTWKDGTWKEGLIWDPDKKGNYEEGWEWRHGYVESPIDPAKYFAKK